MNAEVSRIRKEKKLEDVMENVQRIPEKELTELLRNLNVKVSDLYNMSLNGKADINDYIETYIENIYSVLEMFSEMNIYPDYFFNLILMKNFEYQKVLSSNMNCNTYGLRKKFNDMYDFKIYGGIRNGLKNKNYKIQASGNRSINESFTEMVSFYQKFNLPYNHKEKCDELLRNRYANFHVIMERFGNADDEIDEIECMSCLLFEYLSLFVEMGINPTEYLNNYMEEKKRQRSK